MSGANRRRPDPSTVSGADGAEGLRPRLIRSDVVRYPEAGDTSGASGTRRSESARLRPPRDTGLEIHPRTLRNRMRREKVRRRRRIVAAALAVAALAAFGFWRLTAGQAHTPTPEAKQATTSPGVAVVKAAVPPVVVEPTPYFASYGRLKLRVPVPIGRLTELGWHQASYDYALHLTSLLPTANMSKARKNRGTGRNLSRQESGPDAVLTGYALAMWRNSNDRPDSAVDVGAPPGTPVLAPLSGTVVLVKPYELYGKYPDVRIHIQPEGRPDLDLVLIHVQNPSVRAGDKVVAGVTQVGEVRELAGKVPLQLRSYTRDPGNHVHMQLNNAKDPDYKGLEEAIRVPASGAATPTLARTPGTR